MKILSLLIISGLFSMSGHASENPVGREVLLDNDQVQVVRLTYPPGTESGMHSHEFPYRVVYFVKGGKLELVPDDPGKDSQVVEFEDGETIFLPGTTHNVKNIGDSEIIIVETEIK